LCGSSGFNEYSVAFAFLFFLYFFKALSSLSASEPIGIITCVLLQVFSQDKGVCEAVERAFITIYIKESSSETALSLINLTLDATIGDLTSIEALVSKFTATGDISRSTVLHIVHSSFTYVHC
jgi:hypothetical protein